MSETFAGSMASVSIRAWYGSENPSRGYAFGSVP